jgi:hypothetical protein
MNILFDQGTPAPLRSFLVGHTVVTAFEKGWSTKENGDLIREAEAAGFEVLLSTDTNLKYQQQVRGRLIGIVVLSSTSWPKIQRKIPAVVAGVETVGRGGYLEIEI